jgi:hypothetical protein
VVNALGYFAPSVLDKLETRRCDSERYQPTTPHRPTATHGPTFD